MSDPVFLSYCCSRGVYLSRVFDARSASIVRVFAGLLTVGVRKGTALPTRIEAHCAHAGLQSASQRQLVPGSFPHKASIHTSMKEDWLPAAPQTPTLSHPCKAKQPRISFLSELT